MSEWRNGVMNEWRNGAMSEQASFDHSAIPPFCHSAILPFRHSPIAPFPHSALPITFLLPMRRSRHLARPRPLFLALLLGAGLLAASVGSRQIRAAETPALAPAAAGEGEGTQAVALGLTGLSGRLRAMTFAAAHARVLYPAALTTPGGDSMIRLPLVSLAEKRGPSWRAYRVGYWPRELSGGAAGNHTLPAGFIAVTPENERTLVSAHFRLGDFLTHGQSGVWPKMLVLRMPLVDKLELVEAELAALGKPSALKVMSGFRTPEYNAQGVGPLGGRARDSRHMYGEAADVFVDADGDGRMDDLTGDGRVTVADARYLAAVAERVEQRYPEVTGGIGIYPATREHGPFVHLDVRGYRARW
jgi:hypothetical protein